MKKIEITFISCVKNEIKYIEYLIKSIENTSPNFLNWKIIFIDDHSSDGTFEFLTSYKSSKIKVFKNNYNGKVFGTILGIEKSKTEWIKFIDGDDFLSLESLEFSDFNCDAFYHDYFILKDDIVIRQNISKSIYQNRKQWIYELRSIPKAMFFVKKKFFLNIHGLNECIFEDLYINQRIFISCNNINKVDKPLYYYRQHKNNFYGNSFIGNRNKIRLLGKRIENMVFINYKYFKEIKINKQLNIYSKFLQEFNFHVLVKLIFSPRLFLKAIYYYLISKINR